MQTDGSPAAPSGVQVCVEPIQPPWQLPDPTVLPWHTAPPARQPPVTAGPSPLIAFDDLLDLERSRAFHEGREALGLSSMESLLEALIR